MVGLRIPNKVKGHLPSQKGSVLTVQIFGFQGFLVQGIMGVPEGFALTGTKVRTRSGIFEVFRQAGLSQQQDGQVKSMYKHTDTRTQAAMPSVRNKLIPAQANTTQAYASPGCTRNPNSSSPHTASTSCDAWTTCRVDFSSLATFTLQKAFSLWVPGFGL